MQGRKRKAIFLISISLIILGLFNGHSSAESEFRADKGIGWSITPEGVFTIETNTGWQDFLKNGYVGEIDKLVIGKRLTEFYLFDPIYEIDSEIDCPVIEANQIEVEAGNPVFIVKDGLLINQTNNTIVLADTDQKMFMIPEGITTIGTWAFRNAEVETVQFPSTLQTIGIFSFCGCKNLTTPDFPASLTSILTAAFCNCENVDQIILPESLRVIGSGAFDACGIHEIVIPNGIQEMESGVFYGCKNLKRVVLPESLKRIENAMFRDCTNLEDINIPNGLEYIGSNTFQGCENLTITSLPDGLTYIGAEAFNGCNMGDSLKLPASLQEIGAGAFMDSKFFLVEFPEALKIGESAFGRIHVAVLTGSDYEFSYGSINHVDDLLFLNTPPRGIQEDSIYVTQQVLYTEEYADAWKPITANGFNGWPTTCISLEEANNRIAQAAIPTPKPTRTPETTTEVLGMQISTPEPNSQPDQPTADTKTDPLVYLFAGLLVLVVAGIVVIGVKTRKKQHDRQTRKG